MTDQELDQMLRRALLDAAAQEAEALPQEPPELSPRHGRSMRAMLRDPLSWARSRRRPALRTAARHAAAVLVTVSPQARADITRWVAEQTGNVLDFQFRGDSPAQPIPQYQITALPEGYVETERTTNDWITHVEYTCADKNWITFSYVYMHDGASTGFSLSDGDKVQDVTVGNLPGKLILAQDPEVKNALIWIDSAQNLQFSIIADVDESVIIAMAESISLCDPTK